VTDFDTPDMTPLAEASLEQVIEEIKQRTTAGCMTISTVGKGDFLDTIAWGRFSDALGCACYGFEQVKTQMYDGDDSDEEGGENE